MSVFVSESWSYAVLGIDHQLLLDLYSETLRLADALPVYPSRRTVQNFQGELAAYRTLILRARAASRTPAAWPVASTSDVDLALWCLGLALHLSVQGGH